MEIRFDGKTAVVFGGGRGIGKAISRELAKAGATVYLASHPMDNDEATADEFIAEGFKAVYAGVEVTDYDQVDAFIERALQETGRLDIGINNAGIGSLKGNFMDAKPEDVRRILDVNVMGVNNGIQAELKRMIPFGYGKIVSTSSFTGRRACASTAYSHYGTSKAAVLYLTQAAAYLAAPHNINVNSVCPGIVRTAMWEGGLTRISNEQGGRDREEIWQESLKKYIPMARGAQTVEDIAYAVLFLCSEYADHITGQGLYVDGGAAME